MIDVTRLLGRLLKGRLPTGVDRVGIEYLRHYGHRSRLAVRFGKFFLMLPADASVRLSLKLLNTSGRLELSLYLLRDIWRIPCCRGLCNAWLLPDRRGPSSICSRTMLRPA